jgi:hypothetical protein
MSVKTKMGGVRATAHGQIRGIDWQCFANLCSRNWRFPNQATRIISPKCCNSRRSGGSACHSSDRSLAETIVVNYIWDRLAKDAQWGGLRCISHETFRKV